MSIAAKSHSSYLESWQDSRQERCRLMIAVAILLHLLFIFGIELEQVRPLHGKPTRHRPLNLVIQNQRSSALIVSSQPTTTNSVVSPIKITQAVTAQAFNQTILVPRPIQPQRVAKKTIQTQRYSKLPAPAKSITHVEPTIATPDLPTLPNIGMPVIAAPEPAKPASNLPDNMDKLTVIGIPVQTPAPALPLQKTTKPASTITKPEIAQTASKPIKSTIPTAPPVSQTPVPQIPAMPAVPATNVAKPKQPDIPVASVPMPMKQPTVTPPAPIANTVKPIEPVAPVAIPEPIKQTPITAPTINAVKPTIAEPTVTPALPSKPIPSQTTVSESPVVTPKPTQPLPPITSETPATPSQGAEQNTATKTTANSDGSEQKPTANENLGRSQIPMSTDTESMDGRSTTPERYDTKAQPEQQEQQQTEKSKNAFPKRLGDSDKLLTRDWDAMMKKSIRAGTEPEGSYAEQMEKHRKRSSSLVFHTEHDYSNLSGRKKEDIKQQPKSTDSGINIGDCSLSLKTTTEQDIKSGKRQAGASIPINCDF